jgi:hypothetical protein
LKKIEKGGEDPHLNKHSSFYSYFNLIQIINNDLERGQAGERGVLSDLGNSNILQIKREY